MSFYSSKNKVHDYTMRSLLNLLLLKNLKWGQEGKRARRKEGSVGKILDHSSEIGGGRKVKHPIQGENHH